MGGNLDLIKFTVTAGMTPEDVRNSKQATDEQKSVAFLFDTDGVPGFSQDEADAFNNAEIKKKGKVYSIWTQYGQAQERYIKYKENKYIKTNDYEGNWAISSIKQVWDKDKEYWRTTLDCTYNNHYIERLYYTRRQGRKEITENFRGPMVITDDTKTTYDKQGNVIKTRHREYNRNGKVINEIKDDK